MARGILQFLKTLFGGSAELNQIPEVASSPRPLAYTDMTVTRSDGTTCEIFEAAKRLAEIERILIAPTPEAIREAGVLLEQAAQLVDRFSQAANAEDPVVLRNKLDIFQKMCARVSRLLEGARKAQWIRMRAVGAFTQTYTPSLKTETWKPSRSTLNLEM